VFVPLIFDPTWFVKLVSEYAWAVTELPLVVTFMPDIAVVELVVEETTDSEPASFLTRSILWLSAQLQLYV
jgi:hypothetical protein